MNVWMYHLWNFILILLNLTLKPCFRDAFPTSRTPCGILDGTLRRWDFRVNFVEVIQWANSLKLRPQAQISALQQQNAMLNQHLHSQAQSHINHLHATAYSIPPTSTTVSTSISFIPIHTTTISASGTRSTGTLRQLQPPNLGLPRPSILMKYLNR